jgi:hypothetical protein
MIARRLIFPVLFLVLAIAPVSRSVGAGLADDWLGAYAGTVSFHMSFPPRDDFSPRDDPDDLVSDGVRIRTNIAIHEDSAGLTIWLSVSGGAMRTAQNGETLGFGPLEQDRAAPLVSAKGVPHIRQATLRLTNGKLSEEVQFQHADGNVWWRYVTLTRTAGGISVLIWVFDRDGTGARGWAGELTREK